MPYELIFLLTHTAEATKSQECEMVFCFAFTRKPRRTFDVRAHNKIICFIRQRKLSPAARGESVCIDEVIERLSDIRSVYPLMTDLSRECCVVLPTANI